jgi:hypothetical protein
MHECHKLWKEDITHILSTICLNSTNLGLLKLFNWSWNVLGSWRFWRELRSGGVRLGAGMFIPGTLFAAEIAL